MGVGFYIIAHGEIVKGHHYDDSKLPFHTQIMNGREFFLVKWPNVTQMAQHTTIRQVEEGEMKVWNEKTWEFPGSKPNRTHLNLITGISFPTSEGPGAVDSAGPKTMDIHHSG